MAVCGRGRKYHFVNIASRTGCMMLGLTTAQGACAAACYRQPALRVSRGWLVPLGAYEKAHVYHWCATSIDFWSLTCGVAVWNQGRCWYPRMLIRGCNTNVCRRNTGFCHTPDS